MRPNKTGLLGLVAFIVIFLLLAAGGAWVQAKAPCYWWSYSPVKDVPARCVMQR